MLMVEKQARRILRGPLSSHEADIGMSIARKCLHQIDDLATGFLGFDLLEGSIELQPLRTADKIHYEGCLVGFSHALGIAVLFTTGNTAGHIGEEKFHGDFENVRDREKTTCSDAVRAFFVLLYLLKCQAKTFTETFLAHSDHHPTQPNSTADVNIDGVGRLGHNMSLLANFLCIVIDMNLKYKNKNKQTHKV